MNPSPEPTPPAPPVEGTPAAGAAGAPPASASRWPDRRVYDLHTAMWDDVESGSIWISAPTVTSRSIVRVRNPSTRRVVHCEAKMVDEFFLRRFSEQTGQTVPHAAQAVFISAWYRKQLGLATKEGQVELEIVAAESFLGRLRACLRHPQVVVRIATILGLWSVALGLTGLALGVIALIPRSDEAGPRPGAETVVPAAEPPRAAPSAGDPP